MKKKKTLKNTAPHTYIYYILFYLPIGTIFRKMYILFIAKVVSSKRPKLPTHAYIHPLIDPVLIVCRHQY